MSTLKNLPAQADVAQDSCLVEGRLGQVLALIHRILPRLDEPNRAADVQAALQKAASLLESARQAHAAERAPQTVAGGPQRVSTEVAPEIAAVIAAAVSVSWTARTAWSPSNRSIPQFHT